MQAYAIRRGMRDRPSATIDPRFDQSPARRSGVCRRRRRAGDHPTPARARPRPRRPRAARGACAIRPRRPPSRARRSRRRSCRARASRRRATGVGPGVAAHVDGAARHAEPDVGARRSPRPRPRPRRAPRRAGWRCDEIALEPDAAAGLAGHLEEIAQRRGAAARRRSTRTSRELLRARAPAQRSPPALAESRRRRRALAAASGDESVAHAALRPP